MSKVLSFLLFFCLYAQLSTASARNPQETSLPASVMLLDSLYTHHILIAEKSTHLIHLYANKDGLPHFVRSYQAATGKRRGNKFVQGDHKTPEGIYLLQSFIPGGDLVAKYGKEGEIYGAGAFTSNYPNIIDRRQGKTGGGIWLHSTNDNSRINKGLDSRGCVVVVDQHLKDLSRYIELNKSRLIVVEELKLLPKKTWELKKEELLELLNGWRKSWEEEEFPNYISYYHPQKFQDSFRGGHQQFKNYKRAVFNNPGKPKVQISDISILSHEKYSIIQFKQQYQSNTIDDTGLKTLYVTQDNDYNWKIIAEQWSKITEVEEARVAFKPSNRFFNE